MHAFKFMALSMFTLAVGLAADHPITISNGSPLTLEHDSWNKKDDHNLGTAQGKRVRSIDVTSNGVALKRIRFKLQQLELHLTYGSIHLAVISDPEGKDPVLTLDASLSNDFSQNRNQFVSKDLGTTIQGLTIKRAGVDVTLSGPILNATTIRIHYQ